VALYVLSRGLNWPECKSDLSSPSRLRIRRAAPLIPPQAFMSWPGTSLLYLYSTVLKYVIFFTDFRETENGGMKIVSLEMTTVHYKILTIRVSKAY